MKHNRLFAALILCILFVTKTYSQGCYYPASFSYNNIGGGTVSFVNTSTYISASSWDFGDGNTSTQNHPTHTYTSNGYYTVTLDLTYVFNMGVYGSFTCYSTTSSNIFINNANSTYGCMDTSACNYSPSATIDDGSCILASTLVTLQMNDSYGDGWNGDTWSAISTTGANGYGAFTLNSGSSGSESFLLVDGCYDISVAGGSYPYETSWSLIDNNGTTLASGGSPYNSNLCSYAIVSGCTDSLADNYNLSATIDDGSCAYTVYGCTDPLANNYAATATVDDGTCTYSVTCSEDAPTGIYADGIISTRAYINWDNMNNSATGCIVDQYRLKYRAVGSSTWIQKDMGQPLASCLWPCNKVEKLILNLTPSTQYEYQMKAWYCGGGSSSWTAMSTFTTLDDCPNVGNLAVTTPNPTKATFTWDDSNGAYSFARIKLRVDTAGGTSWFNAGGMGIAYGTFTKNKNNLLPGTSYIGKSRAWCDPNGGPYKAPQWTTSIYWTQPSLRIEGGSAITNLDVYPNPSRDIFNVSFTSEDAQNLKIRVFNVIGEELISDNLEQFIGEYTKQIDLTNNAKGIYFLEIETDRHMINTRLIFQ